MSHFETAYLNMKMLLAIILAFLSVQTIHATQTYLTYADFLNRVKAGQVKSVNLGKYSGITGVVLINGQEQPFQSYGEVGTGNDPLLTALLTEKLVATHFSTDADPLASSRRIATITGFIFLLVPLVVLILFIACYVRLGKILRKLNERNSPSTPILS